MAGGYGGGPWGLTPWGGSFGESPFGVFQLLSAQAVRENMFRLEFNSVVDWTEIGGPHDGSLIEHYSVRVVASTVGMDSQPVREVKPVKATRTDPSYIGEYDYGRFIDLTVDRPMSCFPCHYYVGVSNLYGAGYPAAITVEFEARAVYRMLAVQLPELMLPKRDIANPQTLSAFYDPLPHPDASLLGTFVVDDTGDYGADEGKTNLRKRIIRRLISREDSFPHAPGYGVGVPQELKKSNTAATRARLAAKGQKQISLEPDVSKCVCQIVQDENVPNLIRYRTYVRTKDGLDLRVDVPFVV